MINQWGLHYRSFPGGVQDSPQLRPGSVPRPGPSMRVTSIDPSAVAVAAIDEKADWEFCWQNFASTFHIQEGLDPNEVLITNLPNWVKYFLRNMPTGIKCLSHLTTCFGLRLANSVYSGLSVRHQSGAFQVVFLVTTTHVTLRCRMLSQRCTVI